MTKFSANLGFLWKELPLVEAIRQAAKAGFDAVECHWPYETPAQAVRDVLEETGLPMISINTRKGAEGEFGLLALCGREGEARAAIDEAIAYAQAIQCGAIHAMAGIATGENARASFVSNLHYACEKASECRINILIEPINPYDVPGYFLHQVQEAVRILDDLKADNLRLMFDFYHLQILEGDVSRLFVKLQPYIGHVQFASVPDRGAPSEGELNFTHIFQLLRDQGYNAPLGAEYRPKGASEESLGWLKAAKAI